LPVVVAACVCNCNHIYGIILHGDMIIHQVASYEA